MFLGPVIREENRQKTLGYIERGIDEGANLIADGRKNAPEEGYFVWSNNL